MPTVEERQKWFEETHAEVQSVKARFPAGKYWLGDLAYVTNREDRLYGDDPGKTGTVILFGFRDNAREFLNAAQFGGERLEFETSPIHGIEFRTAFGDGVYQDQFNEVYPVDSGTLGCIQANGVTRTENVGMGKHYTFAEPFEVTWEKGFFRFDSIEIDTR